MRLHLVLTALALAAVTPALAAPVTLTHSGRLLDASGQPQQGPATLAATLVNAASGGATVWTDTFDVQLNDGYYTLTLEDGTPTLDSALFSQDLWLQLSANGVPVGGPQPLHRVPNAVHATTVSGGDVVIPTAGTGSCATPGALARDTSTGALRVCHGSGGGGSYVDVASSDQIQQLIDDALGTAAAPIGTRVGTDATRVRSYAGNYSEGWAPVSGLIIPFTSRGGPIQVNTSIAIEGGSHSSCRNLIDGLPASLYTELDSSYYWSEGLEFSNDGWMMWDPPRLYEGVAAGRHTLTIDCHTDSTSAAAVGNGRMTHVASVIAYDPVETAAIKAWSDEAIPNMSVGTSWTVIPGISIPFTAQGGIVRLSWAVPFDGGSHSACRPRIDGTVAGAFEGDTVGYIWSEGLVRSNDNWGMHNRTRLYASIPSGSHTLTLECITDGGSVNVGNSRVGPAVSVTTYPPSGSGAHPVFANTIGSTSGNYHNTWRDIPGLETTLDATGGPVEIGVSIPMNGGSHAACRPTLDGEAIPHPVDDFSYIWHEGIHRTNDGWGMWDRVRVYDDIAAGTYSLGVQCMADSTASLSIGVNTTANGSTNQVWAIAYDE